VEHFDEKRQSFAPSFNWFPLTFNSISPFEYYQSAQRALAVKWLAIGASNAFGFISFRFISNPPVLSANFHSLNQNSILAMRSMTKFAGMAKRGGREWLYFYLIWPKARRTSSLAIHNYTYFANRYLTLPSSWRGIRQLHVDSQHTANGRMQKCPIATFLIILNGNLCQSVSSLTCVPKRGTPPGRRNNLISVHGRHRYQQYIWIFRRQNCWLKLGPEIKFGKNIFGSDKFCGKTLSDYFC